MTDNLSSLKRHDWRKLVKKLRRKRIRREAAMKREKENLVSIVEADVTDSESENEDEKNQRHQKWLRDEEESQKRWKDMDNVKKAHEAEKRATQERIRKEWESIRQQKLELKRQEEEKAKELDAKINRFVEDEGPVPVELTVTKESNPGKQPCPFFSKVAACRFGSACSRNHVMPSISSTLLIPGFYTHFTLYQARSAEYDTDVSLEYSDDEMNKDFKEFFDDIAEELGRFGEVQVLVVCKNSEPHLRGNVYVMYKNERMAFSAARALNARWYAGRQLTVQFAHVPDWGAAICGDFFRSRCPKGNECNFLHTFKNPNRRFLPKREDKHQKEPTPSRRWRWSESPAPERSNLSDRNHEKRRSRSRSRSHERRKNRRRDRDSRERSSRSKGHRSRRSSRSRSPSGSGRHKRREEKSERRGE